MLDEQKIHDQLAAYARQLDWLSGAIQALKLVLGELPPPPPSEGTS